MRCARSVAYLVASVDEDPELVEQGVELGRGLGGTFAVDESRMTRGLAHPQQRLEDVDRQAAE
jgi:hypothetical protein